MIFLYQKLTSVSAPMLSFLLNKRLQAGKEDETRLDERKGIAQIERPKGTLYWVHAASVGEAQSALILIKRLLDESRDIHILVTSGTKSSAHMLETSLPERSFHQYYPLDHPDWVVQFLDHWQPDFAFWMESELWPNMLLSLKKRDIPTALINARLSPLSLRRWRLMGRAAKKLLSTFSLILCQTEKDAEFFQTLGASNVHTSDNLKFSAHALGFDEDDLHNFNTALRNRPAWVYASSHKGEEELAARIHERLKPSFPDILTIIVPRHPERRDEIAESLSGFSLKPMFRGEDKILPNEDTEIYIADTFGELGLFYRDAPIAFIGRSFSDDGGGGHNPIEAAQLHCAVVFGPNVQNLQAIFDEMEQKNAAYEALNENALFEYIHDLLIDPALLTQKQEAAFDFAQEKTKVIKVVMEHLKPFLDDIPLNSRNEDAA